MQKQTGEIKQDIAGLELRLGQRLDDHDNHLQRLDAHNVTQDATIDDLTLRMGKLEAIISSKTNGLSFTSQPKNGAEK